jgi:hypothetical protein
MKDQREHFQLALNTIHQEVGQNHKQGKELTPASKVIELVEHDNVCDDHASTIRKLSEDPESRVLSICGKLKCSRPRQGVEAYAVDDSTVPNCVEEPLYEQLLIVAQAFQSYRVQL